MIGTKDRSERIALGRQVEKSIIESLQKSGMKILNATNNDDCLKKVDAWVEKDGKKVGLQIKFRETGKDFLFEVFDTFIDFKHPKNKIGRDLVGDASLYAVQVKDKINIVQKEQAIDVIHEMLDEARCNGWNDSNSFSKTLYYSSKGHELQLKLQNDPNDGRKKIVAYIPQEFFQNSKEVAV